MAWELLLSRSLEAPGALAPAGAMAMVAMGSTMPLPLAAADLGHRGGDGHPIAQDQRIWMMPGRSSSKAVVRPRPGPRPMVRKVRQNLAWASGLATW